MPGRVEGAPALPVNAKALYLQLLRDHPWQRVHCYAFLQVIIGEQTSLSCSKTLWKFELH
jgi:hypothetical protein